MKYVITAKNIFDPKINHITNPLERTEICTEMVMTRLEAIRLLNEGIISKNDTIVTRIDRKCLYENLFDNVIDYQDFLKLTINAENDDVIDLVYDIDVYEATLPYKPFYQRFEKDRNEIFNINLHEFNTKRPFICILNRQMMNHYEKNIPNDYFVEFIHEIENNTEFDIYVFGEKLKGNRSGNLVNMYTVSDFKTWCSLINNQLCKSVVSSCSGGVYPVFFCGHDNSKLIIIDQNRYTEKHSDSVSFYNECINFKKVEKKIYFEIPEVKELAKEAIGKI